MLLLQTSVVFSQNEKNNTVTVSEKIHSPKKATYLALVPGLGQIYNKKYWKLPIVYAGFGVTGYFAFSNRNLYLDYNQAYKCSVNLGEDCTNELAQKYTSDELSTIRDYYRRNMELSYIIMGAWYILQILDASVDAHLYNWEVDENLSVDIQPVIQPARSYHNDLPSHNSASFNGIKVRFKF